MLCIKLSFSALALMYCICSIFWLASLLCVLVFAMSCNTQSLRNAVDFCTLNREGCCHCKTLPCSHRSVSEGSSWGAHASLPRKANHHLFPAAKLQEHCSFCLKDDFQLLEKPLLVTGLVGKSHLRKGHGTLGQAGQERRHFCPGKVQLRIATGFPSFFKCCFKGKRKPS